MNPKPFYKAETLVIAAGDSRTVQRVSNFITCLEATADFRIQIDNTPETDFQKGLTFNTDIEFNEVRFVNNGAEELTITIGFGRGGVRDGRLILAGASLETTATSTSWQVPASPNRDATYNNVSLPQGSTKVLASANPNRIKLMIHNHSGTGTAQVRFGDVGTDDGNFGYPLIKLAPNETYIIEGTSEVKAICNPGTCVIATAELVYV